MRGEGRGARGCCEGRVRRFRRHTLVRSTFLVMGLTRLTILPLAATPLAVTPLLANASLLVGRSARGMTERPDTYLNTHVHVQVSVHVHMEA